MQFEPISFSGQDVSDVSYVQRESSFRYRVASAIHDAYISSKYVILHASYLITLVTGASREKKKPRCYLRKSTCANHRARILRHVQKFSQHASSVFETLNICNFVNSLVYVNQPTYSQFSNGDQLPLFTYKKFHKMMYITRYIHNI